VKCRPKSGLSKCGAATPQSEIIACRLARHMPSLTSTFSWLLLVIAIAVIHRPSIVSYRPRHEIVLEGKRQH
jgi:hypothetical protein